MTNWLFKFNIKNDISFWVLVMFRKNGQKTFISPVCAMGARFVDRFPLRSAFYWPNITNCLLPNQMSFFFCRIYWCQQWTDLFCYIYYSVLCPSLTCFNFVVECWWLWAFNMYILIFTYFVYGGGVVNHIYLDKIFKFTSIVNL